LTNYFEKNFRLLSNCSNQSSNGHFVIYLLFAFFFLSPSQPYVSLFLPSLTIVYLSLFFSQIDSHNPFLYVCLFCFFIFTYFLLVYSHTYTLFLSIFIFCIHFILSLFLTPYLFLSFYLIISLFSIYLYQSLSFWITLSIFSFFVSLLN
jgi:hypothetical protein